MDQKSDALPVSRRNEGRIGAVPTTQFRAFAEGRRYQMTPHSVPTTLARLAATTALALLLTFLTSGPAFGQGSHSLYSAASGPTLGEEFGESCETYLGPSDLALDGSGEWLYVACYDGKSLLRAHVDGQASTESLSLGFKAARLALFSDGTKLAVVGGEEDGQVAIVEVAKKTEYGIENQPMTVVASGSAGHNPTDVAARQTEVGTLLYVANCFAGEIRELDASTLETTRRWEAGREPYAIALTPAGDKLVVANRVTDMPANQSFSHANARIIDLTTGELTVVELTDTINLLQDVAISPDGRYAFISAVSCKFTQITGQVTGGWLAENCVVCVDVEEGKNADNFFLDDSGFGSGNPWGVACTSDGDYLVVTLSGTDEVVYMPLRRMIEKIKNRPDWARPGYGGYAYSESGTTVSSTSQAEIPYHLRVKFGFKGLREVVTRGEEAFAVAYFDDVICRTSPRQAPDPTDREFEVYEEDPPTASSETSDPEGVGEGLAFVELAPRDAAPGFSFNRSFARLAPTPVLTMRRRGEIMFHDATACLQHWLSCVTCHPDARADGFNWDLLNDGSGNLKNTKSMLLSHETPPCMITGIRADGETAVRAGFIHILFTDYDEENACCVDEYLKGLRPLGSPRLVDGQLSESAVRGRKLFNSDEVGCAKCHIPSTNFTDLRMHRVGSQAPDDYFDKFDTPTLVEVWRTAPYMNTGEYTTIREVLEVGRHGVKKGQFEKLSPEEQDDLIEYILSL